MNYNSDRSNHWGMNGSVNNIRKIEKQLYLLQISCFVTASAPNGSDINTEKKRKPEKEDTDKFLFNLEIKSYF